MKISKKAAEAKGSLKGSPYCLRRSRKGFHRLHRVYERASIATMILVTQKDREKYKPTGRKRQNPPGMFPETSYKENFAAAQYLLIISTPRFLSMITSVERIDL